MSKASSKVIKADRLSVSLPYSFHKNTIVVDVKEQININDAELTNAKDGEGHHHYSADSATQDAASILAETEEMVKELLTTAKEQAEMIIDQAREEAENLVFEARGEVESLKKQAKQNGHNEGYAQGINSATTEAAAIREEARQMLIKASAERERLIAGTEQEIIKLVLEIAEKIIREELASRTELVGIMVKEALAKATDREAIIIKVNPEDLDYIMGISEELRKEIKGIRKFKVISDGIISRGGCIVETPNGSVDARIERQLTEIREALMEVS